jgi:hypothetical protein
MKKADVYAIDKVADSGIISLVITNIFRSVAVRFTPLADSLKKPRRQHESSCTEFQPSQRGR